MKNTLVCCLVAAISLTFAGNSFSKEKEFITVGGEKLLRCQPVPGYTGKVNGQTGDKEVMWMITMDPAAAWNSPACVARGNELVFKDSLPTHNVICGNAVKKAEQIKKKIVKKEVPKKAVVAPDIRKITSGDDCDEKDFRGSVTKAVLQSADAEDGEIEALEFHYRPSKSEPYKVKRGFVSKADGWIPAVWSDSGSCVREYSTEAIPQTVEGLTAVLLPGESIERVVNKKGDAFTDKAGNHNTTAVYVIKKSGTPVATLQSQKKAAPATEKGKIEGKTYTLTLPPGNQM